MLLYTFAIHDAERDVPYFSCTADSEAHATAKCRSIGYKDFTLSESRPLEAHETPEFVRLSIAKNPFVGEQWLPAIEAFCIFIESRETDRRQPTWSVDVIALVSPDAVERRCFIQGLVEADGSMHLELSGDLSSGSPFTAEQVEQLEFVGWSRLEKYEIFYIEFEPGWVPLYIGERIIEALTSVHGITENDIFAFTHDRSVRDAIDTRTSMVDITIHEQPGVAGLHTMPGSAAIQWSKRLRQYIEDQDTQIDSGEVEERLDTTPEKVILTGKRPTKAELTVPEHLSNIFSNELVEGQIHAAAFRTFEGDIVLEVLPRIFLNFPTSGTPSIEDFYFQPRPWLSINSRLFKTKLSRVSVDITHWGSALTDFAQMVYSEEIYGVLDDLREVSIAELVARGIYGNSQHNSGELLVERAETLSGEVSAFISALGSEYVSGFEDQSWLAYIPEYGSRRFYRPITESDLKGWGIPEDTLRSLSPRWSRGNILLGGLQKMSGVTMSDVRLDNFQQGYREIRICELYLDWQETIPNEFEVEEFEAYPLSQGEAEIEVYRANIVSELANLMGMSRHQCEEWLSLYSAMFTIRPISVLDGPIWSPADYLLPHIVRIPTESEAQQLRREVADLLFGMPHAVPTSAEAVLSAAIISEVFQLTLGDQKPNGARELVRRFEFNWREPFGVGPIVFLGIFDFADGAPDPNYIQWMADRVASVLLMLSNNSGVESIAKEMDPLRGRSVLSVPRMDELLFATLFLDLLFGMSAVDFPRGFDELFRLRAGNKIKDLLSSIFYRQPTDVQLERNSKKIGGHVLTADGIALQIDVAMHHLCSVTQRIGSHLALTVFGGIDGIQVDVTFRHSSPSLLVVAFRKMQESKLGSCHFSPSGVSPLALGEAKLNVLLEPESVDSVKKLREQATTLFELALQVGKGETEAQFWTDNILAWRRLHESHDFDE